MKKLSNLTQIPFIEYGFCNASDSAQAAQPVLMNQVHSADALFLRECPKGNPAVDALVTKTPGLCLTVKTADCAPVLLVDTSAKIVAAVHAGWKGAFQGILETTVLEMMRHGASVQTIVAGIGPHIQKKSFVAGTDMRALFPVTESDFFTETNGTILFDFDAYVRYRLKRAGVQNIMSSGDDTYSDTSYFSYRREPENTGRQFSFVMIKGV